jgi:ABC-type polysaccharide/polyol phosphate export permease
MHKQQLQTFWYLLVMDFVVLFKGIAGELLDTCVWVTLSIFCNGYVMPQLGTSSKYGALLAIGQIVSSGIFLMYHASSSLVGDFEHTRVVAYELMLPISSWLVMFRRALAVMLKAMALSSVILPLAKLILASRLDLSHFSLIRFLVAFLLINFFCGLGSIFLASVNDGDRYTSRVWVRFVFPLWFLGGSIFPYAAMSGAFPIFGKFLLLNPIVYATELIRAAILPPASHLIPFWVSATVLFFYSWIIFCVGYFRLKKKFDFV